MQLYDNEETKPIANIPPQDILALANSQKRKDLKHIIDQNPNWLTVNQRKVAKKYGFLDQEQLAGVEGAKSDLKKNGYDTSIIPQLVHKFNLNEEEKERLQYAAKRFKDNQKIKDTKMVKEEEKQNAQVQFNSYFIEKYRGAVDFEAKVQVSQERNEEDPAGYYEFLITSSKSDITFLQVISRVIKDEKMEKQKLRLFLAICGLCVSTAVPIDSNLQDGMLNYLATEPEVIPKQVSGFFKLSFLNRVGISAIFNAGTIKSFDKKFASNYDDFWARLEGDDANSKLVFTYLPHTCLILSVPMIKALQDCSAFHGIYPLHLRDLLIILVYSFPLDNNQFKSLLQQVRETTKTDIERMKACQFQQFLEQLAINMMELNARWFRNQNAVHILLTGVLQLVSTNKVPDSHFSKELCDQLINGTITVEELLGRPAQLLSQDSNIMDATEMLLEKMQICNSKTFFQRINQAMTQPYSDKLLTPFNKKGLTLKLQQKMFMSLCQSEKQMLLCTGAGVGKTTFLGGLVLSIALTNNEPIIIINNNKRLLNRDFEDILEWSQKIHKVKSLQISQYSETQAIESITFMTPQELKNAILPRKFHIVVDEFQLLLTKEIINIIPYFESASSFVGVTGSPMPPNYIKLLQVLLPNACMANFPDEYKFNTVEKDVIFVSTILQQLKRIDSIYKDQRKTAPLLCIMNKELISQYKKYDVKRQWVTFMDDMDDLNFNLVLKEKFTQQINGFYGCYVVTEAEGVGIEYPSTPLIDKNGGVAVCLCVQPQSYSDLVQWKRRTGRIGRPGVVHIVFQGKNIGNQNHMNFLEKKLIKQEEKAVRELKAFLKIELDIDEPIDSDSSEEEQKNKQKNRKNKQVFEENIHINMLQNNMKENDIEMEQDICLFCSQQIIINQKHICKKDSQKNGQGESKQQEKGNNKETEHKGIEQKLQTAMNLTFVERIKVIGEDGADFYAELSDFNQFKQENLENNHDDELETSVKELKALKSSNKKRVWKQQNKEPLAKGEALIPVNIGKSTVRATNAFARMSIGENDITPTKNSCIKSSEILVSLKQEGQKKKFAHGCAGAFGFQEHQDVSKTRKRQIRQTQGKEEEGNKKQKLQ